MILFPLSGMWRGGEVWAYTSANKLQKYCKNAVFAISRDKKTFFVVVV